MSATKGPLFDGSADRLAAQMCIEIEQRVAEAGVGIVGGILKQVLRNPTGRYESGIASEPGGGDMRVTDGGIVYGPWLEGTSRRNRETRFKGYATFRRATQILQDSAEAIAQPIVDDYVRRMG